ncbi:MAG: TlpA disulfide reductase family protein [Bryobacteraceae bacterium]
MKRIFAFLFSLPLLGTGPLVPINEAGFQKLVDSHKGNVVLYDFWATWCGSCRAELPQLVLLERRLRARGVEVVTISADDRQHQAAAEKFIQMFDVQGPAYLKQANDDDRFISAIDPQWSGALPALFLYDKSGRKVRSFIGETDLGALERAIHKLL